MPDFVPYMHKKVIEKLTHSRELRGAAIYSKHRTCGHIQTPPLCIEGTAGADRYILIYL